ncbi:adenylosuccinate lyase family protein [Conexibacter stalactiti]|uniref:Adenylosuccinate lyase family protein n=1 Tax=Conexibacter stalactiti TaxID=1940611 RepID=A0ABU4HSF3_9ACTN|nr:adenylosuccinate lyase family protein [Conexibacter stalactiti]MDW5596241.1 adenylosuccinate lyase family protein [Conexibacter stalactiti]MEC5036883.1 adenylosuccinate lyase family protein [Conexibacter stalactiti]
MSTTSPFLLLERLYGDPEMAAIFSERATVRSWLRVEAALAAAQAEVGVLSPQQAEQIAGAAADADLVDLDALWHEARNVGYPIFPLVRQLTGALPDGAAGRVHYGATTQDIMDSGLALQLAEAVARLERLCDAFGDALVGHMQAHRHSTMAGRTHAQHAVPTTFGAKLAGYVAELARHRERLAALLPRVAVVSLAGAGGTNAALGSERDAIREGLAERLGLVDAGVPWHVARDGLAEFGAVAAMLAATAARFAREVIDLSRTEVQEVAEAAGHHRGASSTMPQKANPIGSEAVIGMSASAAALSAALYRAMESGHERAAGEWQIEWQVLPQVAVLAAGALATAHEVAAELRVDPQRMLRNLGATDGRVMAEAHMIAMAPQVGRERAHDLVYAAAQQSAAEDRPLAAVLAEHVSAAGLDAALAAPIAPADYVGDPDAVCDAALAAWQRPLSPHTTDDGALV